MNFYIDSGGTIIATDPERVYQGSAMANTIRLIAPFPLGASVTVSYILPDGTQMQPQLMTANKTLSGIQTETGVNFSVWEQNIGVRFQQVNGESQAVPDFTVLSQVGKVGVVFTITQANAAGQPITQTTARSSFLCERGAPLEMPPEAFDDYESLLNQILGQLSVAVQNDIYLEAAVESLQQTADELEQSVDTLREDVNIAEQHIQDLEDAAATSVDVDLSDTYVLKVSLKNGDGEVVSTSNVDFPVEEMIVSVAFDETTKDLIITLKNGTTLNVPLDDIVQGLLPTTGGTLTGPLVLQAENLLQPMMTITDPGNTREVSLTARNALTATNKTSGAYTQYMSSAIYHSADGTSEKRVQLDFPDEGGTLTTEEKTGVRLYAYKVDSQIAGAPTMLYINLYNASNEIISTAAVDLPEGGGEGGTIVTVDGVAQETWDADTKVDKMTNTATDSNLSQAYIITPNQEVKLLNITEWGASPNTIAKRDHAGRLAVATPSGNNDAANKKYVDELVLGNGAGGTKLYLHTIDALKLVSNDSIPITVDTLIAAFRDSISAHWAENTVLSIARMSPTSITLFGVRVDISTSTLTHVSYSIDFNFYTDTVTEL